MTYKFDQKKESKDEIEVITDLSPLLVDNLRIKKTSEYESLSEEMALLEMVRAQKWPQMRKEAKSVKDAEMEWDASEEGQRMIQLKWALKSTEKKISALRDRLQRLNNEARYNSY